MIKNRKVQNVFRIRKVGKIFFRLRVTKLQSTCVIERTKNLENGQETKLQKQKVF